MNYIYNRLIVGSFENQADAEAFAHRIDLEKAGKVWDSEERLQTWNGDDPLEEGQKMAVQYLFQTALVPPFDWLKELAESFSALNFVLLFGDVFGGTVGAWVYEKGKCTCRKHFGFEDDPQEDLGLRLVLNHILDWVEISAAGNPA
jgi:hypothetical protein